MIRKNPRGDLPQIHPGAFVDPTAILCGLVIVEENVFIGPYAVIRADEMDAYEKVLGDAMLGDATLFAREDYVEEAWRIVDPVLKAGTRIHDYEPGTWGPGEVEQRVEPPGGWLNPAVTD